MLAKAKFIDIPSLVVLAIAVAVPAVMLLV